MRASPARRSRSSARKGCGACATALAGNVGQGERASYELQARLTALDLAGLLGPPRPVTALSGTLDLKGIGLTLADAAAGLTVELRDSTLADRALSRVHGHA